MGKLFFCFLFATAASWTTAQTRAVTVFAPHIGAPIAVHVPQVSLPQAPSFARTQQFRSLYNPLGNNPLVSLHGEQAHPAPVPRHQVVSTGRRSPLATAIESADQTAVNGYSLGQVRQVQQALLRLGYYNGDVDGDFGPNTQNALERYQLSAGEPVTGTLTLGVLGRLGVSGR